MVSSPVGQKEVIQTKKKTTTQLLAEKTQQAALLAAERLIALLEDPDTGNGDVIKAATLILEKLYPIQSESLSGGDYDICIKEA